MAVFHRIREVQEGRQELQWLEAEQRVLRRILHRGLNGSEGKRVGTGKGSNLRRIGRVDTIASERLCKTDGDKIETREHIGAHDVAVGILLVLCIVEADRRRKAVRGVPVNRAEDRPGCVVLTKFFGEALSCLPEDKPDRQAKSAFDQVQRTAGQHVGIAAEVRAIIEFILDRDGFIEIEATDHPIDGAIAGRCEPDFLRERLDVCRIEVPTEQVCAREVGIGVLLKIGLAIGRDRCQRHVAEVEIALEGQATIVDIIGRAEIIRHFIRGWILGHDLAAQQVDDTACRTVHDIRSRAAQLVDRVIVTDQAERHVLTRFEQEFAAQAVTIALIGVLASADVFDIAVARIIAAAQAERERVADRSGDIGLGTIAIIVADSAFDIAAAFEGRLLGDYRDDACRGVLAEQGRLRPAQHFDALDVRQVRNLRRRPRTVHTINEHADRGLDAGIVGAVAKATDHEVRVRRRLELADAERWHEGLEIIEIENLGFRDDTFINDRNGDRNVLERLLPLRRRDRHGLQRAR